MSQSNLNRQSRSRRCPLCLKFFGILLLLLVLGSIICLIVGVMKIVVEVILIVALVFLILSLAVGYVYYRTRRRQNKGRVRK